MSGVGLFIGCFPPATVTTFAYFLGDGFSTAFLTDEFAGIDFLLLVFCGC
jgi:hypothetical protein